MRTFPHLLGSEKQSRCTDVNTEFLGNSVPNVLTLPFVHRLHVRKAQKVALLVVFALGGLQVLLLN